VLSATAKGSSNGLPVASGSVGVTLQGFDPATGRTIWRYSAGHDPGLVTQRLLPPRLDTRSIALPNGGRRIVALDLVHGSHHPIAPSTAAWCRALIVYQQRSAYRAGNGARLTTYIGQFALYPCTDQGRRRKTATVAPNFVASIGARATALSFGPIPKPWSPHRRADSFDGFTPRPLTCGQCSERRVWLGWDAAGGEFSSPVGGAGRDRR